MWVNLKGAINKLKHVNTTLRKVITEKDRAVVNLDCKIRLQ